MIFTVEMPGAMSTCAELAGVVCPCASRAVTMQTTSKPMADAGTFSVCPPAIVEPPEIAHA